MINPGALVVAVFFLSLCASQELSLDEVCRKYPGYDDRNIVISLKSRKNATGQWYDTIVSRVESPFSSDPVHLDVIHKVAECHGKRVVYLIGVTRDASVGENYDKLKFNHRTGPNIAISNKGLTAQRINMEDTMNSSAFTNRPLRDNEIFEVKVDQKVMKWNGGIGIGVTTVSPDDLKIFPEIYKSPHVWIHLNTNVYSNGKRLLTYKAVDLNKLRVGDRVGVKKTEFGVLHFYVNGNDQGPAVSNIPKLVYGVMDLRYDDVKASIVY